MSAVPAPARDIGEQLDAYPAKTIETAGRTFSYREAGTGHPLLLLHGIGAGSGSWLYQLAALAAEFRLIAWDAPGYGRSTPPAAEAPRTADYADALDTLADALGLERFVLVGHSMGGLIAGAYAAAHPQRVRGLLLLNPAGGYGRADAALREQKMRERMTMMETLGPERLAETRSSQLLSGTASREAWELVAWNMRRLVPSGYAQATRMLSTGALADDAARYPGRALVVGSTADTVTPEAGCRRIAAAFPAARYESIEGPGHASYVEAPVVLNRVIASFARECCAGAPA